jgi:nitrate/nitrite-specific signal transduction histidine kinase
MEPQTRQKYWIKNNKGQIFVEYVLLLLIAISTAVLINKVLTKDSDNINDAGVLRQQWYKILSVIAKDKQN